MFQAINLENQLKYFVSSNLLRTVYFAIFDSYLCSGCQVGVKTRILAQRKQLQFKVYKALRIISFKDSCTATGPLYPKRKI